MIRNSVVESIQQLKKVVHLLSDEQYAQPLKILSHASVGNHVRHIIEFLQCLIEGYGTGEVNYDNRKREHRIETDKAFALFSLDTIANNLPLENKDLNLHVNCSAQNEVFTQIPSNYYRELYYNLEHLIHHMAILKIGITETAAVELPKDFGLAPATIKYNSTCAQ